jgi:mannose-6-phosphate isomerase-like protein (cupin superfamily)
MFLVPGLLRSRLLRTTFRACLEKTSKAGAHRTVNEIWNLLTGRGEIWGKLGDHEEIVAVEQGVSATVPAGTHFQFRSFGYWSLSAIGATMPPWPGEEECYEVRGKWTPTNEV